jgi:hypothetical protein
MAGADEDKGEKPFVEAVTSAGKGVATEPEVPIRSILLLCAEIAKLRQNYAY